MPESTNDRPSCHAPDWLTVPLRKDYPVYDIAVPVLPRAQAGPVAPGYRELVERMAHRVARALLGSEHPQRQLGRDLLVAALDLQVRRHLPAGAVPTTEEALQVLGRPDVLVRIAQAAATLIPGDASPIPVRRLSDVASLRMRRHASIAVHKCIYPRLPLPRHDDGRERGFLAWMQDDTGVEAFCRLDRRHAFLHTGPLDGSRPRRAAPDFLVRTPMAVYLVDLYPRRAGALRLQAMMDWCERTNALPPAWRNERSWFFAPLAGMPLEDWRRRGGRLGELLAFSRVSAGYVARPGSTAWC